MQQEIVISSYCPDDLMSIKKILPEYPCPIGRVWSGENVEEIMYDAYTLKSFRMML